ncbi:unnamed protein product [Hymenolepis diminuta]|uniref:DUF1746 domain-containing protein n=2 Tax=Hymenolepis diminuta TaxID=6216 RepID=A0A0R3SLX7_HYMDI|nr:unnamed protein product [Hymenolepis diminuta]
MRLEILISPFPFTFCVLMLSNVWLYARDSDKSSTVEILFAYAINNGYNLLTGDSNVETKYSPTPDENEWKGLPLSNERPRELPGSLFFALATQLVVLSCFLQKLWIHGLPRGRFHISLSALTITDLLLNLSDLLQITSWYTLDFDVLGRILEGNYQIFLLFIDTLQMLSVQLHLFACLECYGLTPKKMKSYSGLTLIFNLSSGVLTPLTFTKPSETVYYSSFVEYRRDAIEVNYIHRLHCLHICPVIVLGAILFDQSKQRYHDPSSGSNVPDLNGDADSCKVIRKFVLQSMAASFFECVAVVLLNLLVNNEYKYSLLDKFDTPTCMSTMFTHNRHMSNSILLYACTNMDSKQLPKTSPSEIPPEEPGPRDFGDNTDSFMSAIEWD